MFKYGIDTLTVNSVMALSTKADKGVLTDETKDVLRKSRQNVETMAASIKAVYGINTGFGPLCDVQITPEETSLLQHNLLITHAVGVGNPIAPQLSKLMMICKVHALCQGYSGIRLEVVERILFI